MALQRLLYQGSFFDFIRVYLRSLAFSFSCLFYTHE